MCEIDNDESLKSVDYIVNIITKLYIIINATKLGWTVEIQDNKIVLSKLSNKLTRLDKNTPQLINALICDN